MTQQKKSVAKGDDSGLAAIIEEKNTLIGSIQETDRRIEEYFNQLSEVHQQRLAVQAEGTRKEMESMLKKIIEAEDACHKELSARKSEMLGRFQELRQGRVLLKSYGSSKRRKPKISKNA